MSNAGDARRRLIRDFRELQKSVKEAEDKGEELGYAASPDPDNIFVWNAVVFGPEDTPWEDGVFKLTMTFPDEYPHKPPLVKFVTSVFHPNVYKNGNICLDILQNQWTKVLDVNSVLLSIRSLLPDPNPSSPANAEAARLYKDKLKQLTGLSLTDFQVRAVSFVTRYIFSVLLDSAEKANLSLL